MKQVARMKPSGRNPGFWASFPGLRRWADSSGLRWLQAALDAQPEPAQTEEAVAE
ncbi:MAG: hypothetical protein WCI11_15150 [Candidatus Methylumidiphilus sp.]